MYPDFKELLSVLNAHRAKYLVVGAYAVALIAAKLASGRLQDLADVDAIRKAEESVRRDKR